MIHERDFGRLQGDARRDLADSCRRVIDELARSTADPQAFGDAADLVRRAADLLASGTHGREYEGAEASLAAHRDHLFIDHSPLAGPLNPLAVPMQLTMEGEQAVGVVTFGAAYEGPPGHVHGGYVAAAFDEVLGMVQGVTGNPGMTRFLDVQYRSPTPLHQPLEFRGRVERVEGRKIFVAGDLRVQADGRLCAESTALFVSVDFSTFDRLMSERGR
jgi:acyl-coenzyme A thioesterase PaaI-like protein